LAREGVLAPRVAPKTKKQIHALLESGKWLATNDETLLKQLQKFQKGFTHLIQPFTSPYTIMDSTTVGGPPEAAPPTVVEAAEGRLHNGGWVGSKYGKHMH
jgi:hypothetical protein